MKSYVETDEQMRMMRSIESKKGEYGEFTLWGPDVNGEICHLRLDPFTLLLMSTNPTDKAADSRKREAGLSLTDAVNSILEERGVV